MPYSQARPNPAGFFSSIMPGPLNMDALFEATHPDVHGAARREARVKFDPYSSRAIKQSLQQMVMGALHEMGGQRWLVQQGQKYPVAFMALISKYIGVDAKAGGGEEMRIVFEVIPGG